METVVILRKNYTARRYRHVAYPLTTDIFGKQVEKIKKCTHCNSAKSFVEFYLKSNKQHIHPHSLSENDLRNFCIPCYDGLNKKYDKGARPKPVYTSTLERFFLETQMELENA